jgi:hypothetical protein
MAEVLLQLLKKVAPAMVLLVEVRDKVELQTLAEAAAAVLIVPGALEVEVQEDLE